MTSLGTPIRVGKRWNDWPRRLPVRSAHHFQAGQLLGLSRFEFDDFLIERGIYDQAYSVMDLQQELADLEKLRAEGLLGK